MAISYLLYQRKIFLVFNKFFENIHNDFRLNVFVTVPHVAFKAVFCVPRVFAKPAANSLIAVASAFACYPGDSIGIKP